MQKGGAHSVTSSQAEDRDIAEGEKGSKGNMETFPQESNGNEIYLKKDFSKTEGEKRMKKVLVITLVLVMAFASSAMAAVNFSGSFTATAKQTNFKLFTENYKLEPKFEFKIGASASSKTTVDEEEVTNWDLSAGLTLDGTTFKVGKYKLGLYDEWFTGYVWGGGQELSDKATYFGMITAAKKATDMRARLIVHVMDYADVTFDFEQPNNLRAFVEGEVEGFDLGLAYARKNWNKDGADNLIVAQAGYDVPAGDIDVRLQGAVGVNLGDDLGLGFGLSADSDITEQLNVNASVTHANKNWAGEGDDVAAENTILGAGAAYTEQEFKVSGDVSYTIKPEGTDNTNTIELAGLYRMSDALDYADLFKADKWYTNDALAVKAFVELTDIKLGEVGAEAVYPVVADMVWARAYGNYGLYEFSNETKQDKNEDGTDKVDDDDEPVWVKEKDKGFKAGAEAYIQATPKLVVRPLVSFEQIGKVLTLQATAKYKIGLSDTTLDFTVKKVTADEIRDSLNGSLIQASVKVPF